MALRADVPLGLAFFDYPDRVVGADRFIRLSGDVEQDMAAIVARLGHRRGHRPHQAAPIKLAPPGKDATP